MNNFLLIYYINLVIYIFLHSLESCKVFFKKDKFSCYQFYCISFIIVVVVAVNIVDIIDKTNTYTSSETFIINIRDFVKISIVC